MALKIYKKGQGPIARLIAGSMGTVFAYYAGREAYVFLVEYMEVREAIGIFIGAVIFAVFGALTVHYVLLNPDTSDYLIETEAEMRKVNWPTKNEVISSTAVVIGCVILLSGYVFINDLLITFLLDSVFNVY